MIEKNGKKYEITECKNYWSVVWNNGGLSVDFQVEKEICTTREELEKYIQKEDMF